MKFEFIVQVAAASRGHLYRILVFKKKKHFQ